MINTTYQNPHVGYQPVMVSQPQQQQPAQYSCVQQASQLVPINQQLYTDGSGRLFTAQGQQVMPPGQQQQMSNPIMPTYGSMGLPLNRPPVIIPNQQFGFGQQQQQQQFAEATNRFTVEAQLPVNQNVVDVQPTVVKEPTSKQKSVSVKDIGEYSPKTPLSMVDIYGTGVDLGCKEKEVDLMMYVIEDKQIGNVTNLDTATELCIMDMISRNAEIFTNIILINNTIYGADYKTELVNLLTGTNITKLSVELNRRTKKAKTRTELIILETLDKIITDSINDILLINYPGTMSIDSFKLDWNDLMGVIHNEDETDPLKIVTHLEISNAINSYLMNLVELCELPDDLEEESETLSCPKTQINTIIGCSAVGIMAREAKLEHIPLNKVLIVSDDNENKYITSVLRAIKEQFINAEEINPAVKNCGQHYLTTLDKRVFKLFWSISKTKSFICRIK